MTSYNKSPYQKIPQDLYNRYSMNGKVTIFDWYINESVPNGVSWTNEEIQNYITRFTAYNIKNNKEGVSSYGNETCNNLLNAFEKYDIKNKKVAVVGSQKPWIEAMLLNFNNDVTTIEYNVPQCHFNCLTCKDYFNFFEKNYKTFDAIITYSSIEHSGLGRYGDPLDPDGDLKTMSVIHNNLIDNGILIWGEPVGKDALSWNAHRIYGPIRLPFIFKGFNELEWFGKSKDELFNQPLQNDSYNPVVVLKKELT